VSHILLNHLFLLRVDLLLSELVCGRFGLAGLNFLGSDGFSQRLGFRLLGLFFGHLRHLRRVLLLRI